MLWKWISLHWICDGSEKGILTQFAFLWTEINYCCVCTSWVNWMWLGRPTVGRASLGLEGYNSVSGCRSACCLKSGSLSFGGTVDPFRGCWKQLTHLPHKIVDGYQHSPSLPGCAGPGVRAPCPKEFSAHCLSVSCLDCSTGWSELSFWGPYDLWKQSRSLLWRGGQPQAEHKPLSSLMPNKWGISQWQAIWELWQHMQAASDYFKVKSRRNGSIQRHVPKMCCWLLHQKSISSLKSGTA